MLFECLKCTFCVPFLLPKCDVYSSRKASTYSDREITEQLVIVVTKIPGLFTNATDINFHTLTAHTVNKHVNRINKS